MTKTDLEQINRLKKNKKLLLEGNTSASLDVSYAHSFCTTALQIDKSTIVSWLF